MLIHKDEEKIDIKYLKYIYIYEKMKLTVINLINLKGNAIFRVGEA